MTPQAQAMLKALIAAMKPALEASLDPVAVVDAQNRVAFCNAGMRSFLGLRGRDVSKAPVFCERVTLTDCEEGCKVLAAIQSGTAIRLDEIPAVRGGEKVRVSIAVVPFGADAGAESGKAVGAVLTLRDSSAEIVLQAKYHKVLELLAVRDAKLAELEEANKTLKLALRKARVSAIT
ncbi:MAG: PAS domain-containing protein [Oligoflexia bacterium]|nr:PAS domain-containing protein [Oligoflexia bacterium]